MFGQRLLPHACLCVIIALGVAWPLLPARGQDRSNQERIDRLERDLNMLQRQVYRGAPPPMMGGDPGAAVNIELRMTHLEEQMREVTGRVEEFMNQIDQLRRRVEQVNGDIASRAGPAGTTSGPLASAAPGLGRAPPPPPPRNGPPFPPPPGADEEDLPPHAPGRSVAALTPPGAFSAPPPPGPGVGGPTPIFGMLTPPGSAPTAPPAPPNREQLASAAPHPPAAAPSPGGSPTEQYNHAFGLLKQADYPAAEAALKSFVDQHPKDPMAGSAQYWLGETYYARGKYMEAAAAFAEGYKRYPKSPKAADDLLKLGMSLGHANQKQNACVAFAQLDRDFPNPGTSVKERAAAEKKRLGC